LHFAIAISIGLVVDEKWCQMWRLIWWVAISRLIYNPDHECGEDQFEPYKYTWICLYLKMPHNFKLLSVWYNYAEMFSLRTLVPQ
jgi:hypothetical protein